MASRLEKQVIVCFSLRGGYLHFFHLKLAMEEQTCRAQQFQAERRNTLW